MTTPWIEFLPWPYNRTAAAFAHFLQVWNDQMLAQCAFFRDNFDKLSRNDMISEESLAHARAWHRELKERIDEVKWMVATYGRDYEVTSTSYFAAGAFAMPVTFKRTVRGLKREDLDMLFEHVPFQTTTVKEAAAHRL